MQEQLGVSGGPGTAAGSQPAASEKLVRSTKPSEAGHSQPAADSAQPDRSFSAIFALETDKVAGQATDRGKLQSQITVNPGAPVGEIQADSTMNPMPVQTATGPSDEKNVVAKPGAGCPHVSAARRQVPLQSDQSGNSQPHTETMVHCAITDLLVATAQVVPISIHLPVHLQKTAGSSLAASASHEGAGTIASAPSPPPAQSMQGAPSAGTIPASPLKFDFPKAAIDSEKAVSLSSGIPEAAPSPSSMADFSLIALPQGPGGAQPTSVAGAQPLAEPADSRMSLPDQIAPAVVHISSVDGGRHISLQLTPSNLGKVEIEIDQKNSGPTAITLTVQNPETFALLRGDMEQLSKALDRAGFDGADKTISLQLAPTHAAVPVIDPGSQGSHSSNQHQPSSGGAWEGPTSVASNNFQTSTGTGDHRRGSTGPWNDWHGEPPPDDAGFSILPATTASQYRAGLNITA